MQNNRALDHYGFAKVKGIELIQGNHVFLIQTIPKNKGLQGCLFRDIQFGGNSSPLTFHQQGITIT